MDYLDETHGMDCDNPAHYLNYKSVTAEDKRDFDSNGWFEVKDNPLSKEGVFQYKGSQIRTRDGDTPPDPDALYWVYRPAEELSAAEALDSFKLVPWIDNHAMLGKPEIGMTPAEKKGVSGIVGEKVYFKDGTLYGNIKVFSEALASSIDNGKRELSLGYRCKYDKESGTYKGQPYEYVQKEIRGNHLALVDDGRMGSDVRVMDSADDNTGYFNFNFKCKFTENDKMTLEEKKALLEKLQAEIAAEEKQQTAPSGEEPTKDNADPEDGEKPVEDKEPEDGNDILGKILDLVEGLVGRVAKLEAPNATDEGEAKEEPKKYAAEDTEEPEKAAEAMDAAAIAKVAMGKIDARNALHARVVPFVGQFNCAAMDAADVADYACKKLNLKPAKGQEMAMLNGYLTGRKPAAKQPTVQGVGMDGNGESFIDKQLKSLSK